MDGAAAPRHSLAAAHRCSTQGQYPGIESSVLSRLLLAVSCPDEPALRVSQWKLLRVLGQKVDYAVLAKEIVSRRQESTALELRRGVTRKSDCSLKEKPMFKFTIRDLLWLTLVVAMGLGWLIRERQGREVVERAQDQATKWRMAAGGLEHAVNMDGWEVTWNFPASHVEMYKRSGDVGTSITTIFHEPSASVE
jgi:hypothetical protein